MVTVDFVKFYKDSKNTKFAENILVKGLNKIKYLYEYHTIDAKIKYIALQDFSFSMNERRIKNGYSIGGVLTWETSGENLIPIDMLPNCCGTLLVRLYDEIDKKKIINKVNKLILSSTSLKGIKIQWDIGRKNHFFNIYKDGEENYYALLHCSLPEVKNDNPLGFGLYYYQSEELKKISNELNTPYGKIIFIKPEKNNFFISKIKQYTEISRLKRELFISNIFDKYEIISNETHFGFENLNMILMGAFSIKRNTVVPLMVAPLKDAFLVSPQNQISLFEGKNYYLVPHGTGHNLKNFGKIDYDHSSNFFYCTTRKGHLFITNDIKEISNDFQNFNYKNIIKDPNNFRIIKKISPVLEFKIL